MLARKNILEEKAVGYSSRIVKLHKYLMTTKHESVLSKQILRSGTSIGSNVSESKFAQSKADFKSKLMIALKEANETKFWLEQLLAGSYITEKQYNSMFEDNVEIIKLLTSITRTLKDKYGV